MQDVASGNPCMGNWNQTALQGVKKRTIQTKKKHERKQDGKENHVSWIRVHGLEAWRVYVCLCLSLPISSCGAYLFSSIFQHGPFCQSTSSVCWTLLILHHSAFSGGLISSGIRRAALLRPRHRNVLRSPQELQQRGRTQKWLEMTPGTIRIYWTNKQRCPEIRSSRSGYQIAWLCVVVGLFRFFFLFFLHQENDECF